MANTDLKGFAPYRHQSGRPVTTRDVLCKAAGLSANTHAGSFVKQLANLDEWDIASAGNAIDSLCVGFKYPDPVTGVEIRSTYLPSTVSYTHTGARPALGVYMTIVDDAFNCEFIGQLSGALVAPTTAETLNFDVVQTATDTASTSGQEIDSTTAATTTAQLRGIRYHKPIGEDNARGDDTTAAHAKLIVRINESESDPSQTATAVGAAS